MNASAPRDDAGSSVRLAVQTEDSPRSSTGSRNELRSDEQRVGRSHRSSRVQRPSNQRRNSTKASSVTTERVRPQNLAGPSSWNQFDDTNLARIAIQRRASLARGRPSSSSSASFAFDVPRTKEAAKQIWGLGGVFPAKRPSVKKKGTGGVASAQQTARRRQPQRNESSRPKSEAASISSAGSSSSSSSTVNQDTNDGDIGSRTMPSLTPSKLLEKPDPFLSVPESQYQPRAVSLPPSTSLRKIITWPFDPNSTPSEAFNSAAPTLLESPRSESDHFDRGSNDSDAGEEEETDETIQVGGQLNENADQWEDEFDDPDGGPPVRNQWGRIRYVLREPLAEFLGMLVLIVLGVGVDCQVKISQNSQGTRSDQAWVWGFATMSAIYIAGGISGGHVNPSITIALATFRGFPWRMVPRYILAQTLGAFCGALIIYGIYYNALMSYDSDKTVIQSKSMNASAPLFITQPNPEAGGTPSQAFFQEVLATAILAIVVLALGDEHNAPPGAGLGAVVIGFVVMSIGNSMGWISGYAINMARDFGPRAALACLGYGNELWTHDSCWWIIGPICGTTIGAVIGSAVYDLLIFVGAGSPVNSSSFEIKNSVTFPATKIHSMVLARFRKTPLQEDVEAKAELDQKSAELMRKMARARGRRAGRAPKEEVAVGSRWTKAEERIRKEELKQMREQENILEQEQLKAIDHAKGSQLAAKE